MKKQLTLSNFENQLSEVLLSRGYDYIENVIDLKNAGNKEYNQWRAKVQGRIIKFLKMYKAMISF